MGRTASPVFLRLALAVAMVLAVLAALLRAGSWQPDPLSGLANPGASDAAARLHQGDGAGHW
jgi:hypothetical protein